MADESPGVRTSSWQVRTGAEREHWEAWRRSIEAARHPALARVTGVRLDGERAVLDLADAGSEGMGHWVERTAPSVPERLAVLRAAAAAVDALHAGAEGREGVPHGGLSSTSIRVTSDGAARLVGFSPWVGADPDTQRFVAPELAAGDAATEAGDVYAFARTVAEVLGGAAVVAAADANDVVRALRSNPDTRRRTRLVRAIQTALTSPPETRPQPLTSWLAAAVEGTAITEVGGVSRTTPVDDTAVEATARSPRRLALLATAIVVVLAIGLVVVLLRDDGSDPATALTSPDRGSGTIQIGEGWATPCGDATGIAAVGIPPELGTAPITAAELDKAAGPFLSGGRWHTGRLLVSFSSGAAAPIAVQKIEVVPVVPVGQPTWIATVPTDCSADPDPDVLYGLDLDHGHALRLLDRGDPSRFSPSGTFYVRDTPTTVGIDVTSCGPNVAWKLRISYLEAGRTQKTRELDPVVTFGRASHARRYHVSSSRAAPSFQDYLRPGNDPSCALPN